MPETTWAVPSALDHHLPWDIVSLVREIVKKTDRLLDIGCGPADKLREIAPAVERVYALDCHAGKLAMAAANLRRWGVANVDLVRSLSQRLPFADESFDLVMCIKAPHDVNEIWRTLKPGGSAVLEKLGARDKWNIKAAFGKDERGWRGFLSDRDAGERLRSLQEEFAARFAQTQIRAGRCRCDFDSLEKLVDKLEQFCLVRGFDRSRDAPVLEQFKKKLDEEGRIESWRERILIQARK